MSDINKLIKSVLSGEIAISTLSKEQVEAIVPVVELMKAKWITPEAQKENTDKAKIRNTKRGMKASGLARRHDAKIGEVVEEQPKKLSVVPPLEKMSTLANGQWSLEKAIKPGPTLDYAKINPKENFQAKATEQDAAAPSLRYSSKPNKGPTYVPAPVKAPSDEYEEMDIEEPKNETADATIANRQKMKKDEAEPHDDEKHEEKEKKKAQSIKEKAEEILNLHKTTGQWSLDKAKKEVEYQVENKKVHGQNVSVKVYDTQEKPQTLDVKPTRSVNNVYGVNYGKKTGVPVKGTLKNT